jgi:sulfotransferase family protein/tetratricopeptide repeat protein
MSDVRSTGPATPAEPGTPVSVSLPLTEAIAVAEQHSQACRLPEAEALCREILRSQPECAPALHLLGIVTFQAGDLPRAIDLVRRAIAANGTTAIYHSNLGEMCRQTGHFAEARAAFETAIVLKPREALHYLSLADLMTFAEGDAHLAAMEVLARDIDSLLAVAQIQLHFALAKAYDDLGRYDEGFRHLAHGNTLNRRRTAYDETQMHDTFERIQATFDRHLIDAKAGAGDRSPVPVFVVGMIRSGTTLIEQILASHPLVFGAGELPDFSRLVHQLRAGPADSIEYPECVPALSGDRLSDLGRSYIDGLRRRAPDAVRITDKMPSHFMYLGLIHLALPRARIIHVRRSPLDTCLSGYSKLFIQGQHFTYDLGELGRYYRHYAGLMAHWRGLLPPGRLLEISYEAVIADLETEARKLVRFCGLPWDPRCIAFHETQRPVRTASAIQVRRPIYRTSQGRWQAYRDHLGPLIGALGDLADPATNSQG